VRRVVVASDKRDPARLDAYLLISPISTIVPSLGHEQVTMVVQLRVYTSSESTKFNPVAKMYEYYNQI
jgi:hypothetical protein